MGGSESKGSVSGDSKGIAQSQKLAVSPGIKQNPNLNTSQGVQFNSREIGSKWHHGSVGVGKVLGLQGLNLTNTSHSNLAKESFRSKPQVERFGVGMAHQPVSQQVLPPGPVDGGVDFTGLRGTIQTGFPGRQGEGGGLASIDIRDIMKNKKNFNDWPRHGGVDPAGQGVMDIAIPPYYENVDYNKVQLKQQFPLAVDRTAAQGFFDN